MTITEAIKLQHTVRGFLKKEVPQEVIREVIELARLAPSNSNTQPWHIAVVSGEARQHLQEEVFKEVAQGITPYNEFPPGGVGLKGKYKERQYACAFQYYDSLGIPRDDKEARTKVALRNWQFFDAPHAAFISYPRTMGRASAIDIGIFLQTVMLLLIERGISCCPQGALASYHKPVRKIVPIPEENAILVGLSFGYKDEEHEANHCKMPREDVDSIASFAI